MFANRGVRTVAGRGAVWGSIAFLIALVAVSIVPAISTGSAALAPPAGPGNALIALVPVSPSHSDVGTRTTSAELPTSPANVPVPPQVLASVKVGSAPSFAAYDPGNGYVYVANTNSNNVSVLNGTTLLATVNTGSAAVGSPDYVTYDPANGWVYVVDRYYFEGTVGAVSILNGTTLLATVLVGQLPVAAVFDAANGFVYVADRGSNNVTVLDGNRTVGNLTVGHAPAGEVYDSATSTVYVANFGSGNVSMIVGLTVVGSGPAGAQPDALAFDPSNGYVYVANNASGNVSVLSGSTPFANIPAGTNPSFALYDPATAQVYVTNANSSNVTLIAGTAVVGSAPAGSDPVAAVFDAANGFVYVTNANGGSVTVIDGAAVVGTVAVGAVPRAGAFDVSDQDVYVTNAGSGNVSVLATAYGLVFNETGLGVGSNWSVQVGVTSVASTGSSIAFAELPGSYAYSVSGPAGYRLVSAVPSAPVAIVDASIVVNVTFAPVSSQNYTVTFVETGLSSMCGRSTVWNVSLGNQTESTSGSSIVFTEPNGTYNYSVGAPSGYSVSSATPASPVAVSGSNITVTISFSHCTSPRGYSITFQESGLRHGTTWCVSVGRTVCSQYSELSFSGLSPGTYAFVVGSVRGYTAQPGSGNVTITGQSVYVHIDFSGQPTHHCGGGGGGWLPVDRSAMAQLAGRVA